MGATDDGSLPLETGQAERQVWLLKLPSMVGAAWNRDQEKSMTDGPLAKVNCTFDPLHPEQQMEFTLELTGSECGDIPKWYSLNLQQDVVPMHIFAEFQGKINIDGKVERKFDMKPNQKVSDEYSKLCRERDRKFNMKTRKIQVLEDDRGKLMRPSLAAPTVFFSKDTKRRPQAAPKGNEGKRTRRDRGELEDIVFQLFERQSNWALKNLVIETDQPVAFLKEILNDLCTYNKRGTNQGTYELKPEYRRNPVVADDDKPACPSS